MNIFFDGIVLPIMGWIYANHTIGELMMMYYFGIGFLVVWCFILSVVWLVRGKK